MKHHLMVGTWTPPGAIFSFEFDDETLELKLVKRTAIPEDEPISWMTFNVSKYIQLDRSCAEAE
jgi:carboxy-cis,cis-muconate cyclase